jgi:hypothetical protein
MPDDSELADINPYDLMEDVLAHLAGGEEYNRACLTDSIGPMFESYGARGATDMNSFNALGVSDRRDKSSADLLDEFQRENGETRHEMRSRDGQDMPTAVGPYPVRWQAWHLASELATHADDIGVPTTHKREEDTRRDWRARFARFALLEMKPDVEVQLLDDGTWVRANGVEATLTDDELIDAVNARLPGDSRVSPALREALSALG